MIKQGIEIGRQSAMVFFNLVPQKISLPLAFIEIAINWPVKVVPLIIRDPLFFALGCKNWMFNRHDKMTANWQLITDFFHKLGVILNVVNGQRAQDNVKLIRQLINRRISLTLS